MTLIELCKMLEIPVEVQDKLIEEEKNIDFENMQVEKSLIMLPEPKGWQGALDRIKELLGPDEEGMRILAFQLHCVCETYDAYARMGISEEIFISTMRFFTRFLQAHKDRHGSYRYVWAWWVPRQISMSEFRIGALEYELKTDNGKKLVDLHIPADADMSKSSLRKSWVDAKAFLQVYYPDYVSTDMVCCSWLLAPSLKHVLSDNSRIMQFQHAFEIGNSEENHLGFMDWVYGSRDIPVDDLPVNTSLQKKLKPYLKNGGTIEWTFGKLKADPFC